MSGKLYATIAILFALALAILGSVLPAEHIKNFMLASNFFNIMIPVLAVAALIKYLGCCGGDHSE